MNREAILALAGSVESRTVTVAGKQWRVRGLLGKERDDFEQSMFVGRGKNRYQNLANIRAKLLVRSIVDEDGRRILCDADADKLGELPAAILDPLFSVAQELSGMSKADVEELAGNSESGPSAASSSD